MFYAKKQTFTEELYVVWAPKWNAKSLVSDLHHGSALTGIDSPAEGRGRERPTRAQSPKAAERDFAYYEGK